MQEGWDKAHYWHVGVASSFEPNNSKAKNNLENS